MISQLTTRLHLNSSQFLRSNHILAILAADDNVVSYRLVVPLLLPLLLLLLLSPPNCTHHFDLYS